jgi:two-component system response regulator FlrC
VASKASITMLWMDATQPMTEDQVKAFANNQIVVCDASSPDCSDAMFDTSDVLVISALHDLSKVAEITDRLKSSAHTLPIIVRVPIDQFSLGIEAMQLGAKTVVPAHITDAMEWADILSKADICAQSAKSAQSAKGFVFVDPISRNLLALTERVAQAEVSVLLAGPTGAGKEVLARILHDSSPRHAGPFIAFNCAAMPENLIEDMLFGHERGSFTGASKCQPGLFEQAQEGTIFLDEIGEMSFHLQAKLLRVLQERRITRLGGQQEINLNIKVVAATNRDLKESIAQRTFREDLYFRLSAFKLTLPALCQRPMDIMPLADQIAGDSQSAGQGSRISDEAAQLLVSYSWPGNVRELQNVITRANILAQQGVIQPQHLIFDDIGDFKRGVSDRPQNHFGTSQSEVDVNQQHASVEKIESLSQAIKSSEHKRIMDVLRSSTSRDEAAETLGISARTLRHKLQRFREEGVDVMRAYAR